MKAERYLLTALCSIACAWVAWMMMGIAQLASHQGPPPFLASFEVLAFAVAAAVPLVHTWWPSARQPWLMAIWAICVLYVCFLATRLALHDPLGGAARLLLWLAIAALVARQSRREQTA